MTILESREETPFPYSTLTGDSPYDRRTCSSAGSAAGELGRVKQSQIANTNMLDYQTNSMGEQSQQQTAMMTGVYHAAQQHHPQQITPSAAQSVSETSYFAYPDISTSSTSSTASMNRHSFTSPLMALHGMTEMKGGGVGESVSASNNLGGYNPALASYYTSRNSMLNATPHGISDILSRPDLHAQLQARLGQGMYYSSCSQVGVGADTLSPTSKDISPNRSAIYHWPNTSPTLQPPQSANWHNKHSKCQVPLTIMHTWHLCA